MFDTCHLLLRIYLDTIKVEDAKIRLDQGEACSNHSCVFFFRVPLDLDFFFVKDLTCAWGFLLSPSWKHFFQCILYSIMEVDMSRF